MSLPDNHRAPWPPTDVAPLLDDMKEADAWLSGDVDRLRAQYAGRDERMPGKPKQDRAKFWTRRGTDRGKPARQQLHVPLAADIASTSADLLFGEPPKWAVPGASEINEQGRPADQDARAAQDRLDMLTQGTTNTLLEAAEVASALGGVYLRGVWDDPDILPAPALDVVHADAAVPEWRWGRLQTVTFWTTVHEEQGKVWRHLERHEPGQILHGLYVGAKDKLGKRVHLASHPSTEGLLDGDDRLYDEDRNELAIPLPEEVAAFGLTVRYIPNVLPNRRRRHQRQGRSDYDGTYHLMDSLDEVWTSWMRDVRLGQARLIVSEQALERRGRGQGASFDVDQELFASLDVEPTADGKPFVDHVQFAIRVEEHERTAASLIERIVSTAGYAPQSFGLHIEGRAEAGTALRVREGKTFRTRDRKQRYWTPAAADMGGILLALDRAFYGGEAPVVRPTVTLGDAIVDDPQETATTVELWQRAKAASIRTRVKMASPELEGGELEAEVQRIKDEEGMGVDDPTGGLI